MALLAEGEAGAVVLADALGDAQGSPLPAVLPPSFQWTVWQPSVSATVMQWEPPVQHQRMRLLTTPRLARFLRSFPPRSSVLPPSSLCAAGSVGEHDVQTQALHRYGLCAAIGATAAVSAHAWDLWDAFKTAALTTPA